MAWYRDNSVCDYLPFKDCLPLRAIGWLERGREFPTGSVPPEVYDRLAELLQDPMQLAICCGFHACDLCQYEAEAHGTKNLLVPGRGCVYVCPELILHYMNAHGYAPPDEFCTAVVNCPPIRSMRYKMALLKNGLRLKGLLTYHKQENNFLKPEGGPRP